MKFSKLLQMLLFGIASMKMGVAEEGGGGEGEGEAAKAAAVLAAKATEDAAAAALAAKEGAKKPTDDEARLLKEVMQKKEALQKTQGDLTAAQERLKLFEGMDPDAVKKLLADKKQAEEAQLVAKGDFENLKQRLIEENTKVTNSMQEQINALQNELSNKSKTVNDLSIGSQFGQSPFITDELTLTPAKARVVYGDHFDLEDGKVVGYDKPRGASNRTPLVDQYGNAVGFDAALRKIVEADPDRDHLLKSKVKQGAGSDSKKIEVKQKSETGLTDSISKIQAGMKQLNLGVGR